MWAAPLAFHLALASSPRADPFGALPRVARPLLVDSDAQQVSEGYDNGAAPNSIAPNITQPNAGASIWDGIAVIAQSLCSTLERSSLPCTAELS